MKSVMCAIRSNMCSSCSSEEKRLERSASMTAAGGIQEGDTQLRRGSSHWYSPIYSRILRKHASGTQDYARRLLKGVGIPRVIAAVPPLLLLLPFSSTWSVCLIKWKQILLLRQIHSWLYAELLSSCLSHTFHYLSSFSHICCTVGSHTRLRTCFHTWALDQSQPLNRRAMESYQPIKKLALVSRSSNLHKWIINELKNILT